MPCRMPRWTVVTNLASPENSRWVGTSWEFFDEEGPATQCYQRQLNLGNCPTRRPYFDKCDRAHLGACHSFEICDTQPPA
jgi:hypothetical protein